MKKFKRKLGGFAEDIGEYLEDYKLYIILAAIAIIMVVSSFYLDSFPFELLTSKIFNVSLGLGTLWFIRRFDFMGKKFSFQKAIQENNIAAGITLAGFAIAIAILVTC